ncbi:hypothetical protein ACI65C_003651 [Semiaphis heraclei]
MLESKSKYIIFGNDADTHTADNNYLNETRVPLDEDSPDVTEAALASTSSSVHDNDPHHVNNNNQHAEVTRLNFVCDVCNRPCLSAAGLGSHRRVHRS